jgi:hypothetical protein
MKKYLIIAAIFLNACSQPQETTAKGEACAKPEQWAALKIGDNYDTAASILGKDHTLEYYSETDTGERKMVKWVQCGQTYLLAFNNNKVSSKDYLNVAK